MFHLEKEMIPILKRNLSRLFGSVHTAEEFVSGVGRPDIVFARASSGRIDCGEAFFDYQTLHLLVKHLNREGRVISVDKILGVDIQNKKRIRAIINLLEEQGFVEFRDTSHLVVRKKYRPAAEEFVSIEAKLSDWKSGVYQAMKYKAFSNSSYLAISEKYLPKVDRDFLRSRGIGLISVSNEVATIVLKAKKNRPVSIVSHYYHCERLINSTEAL